MITKASAGQFADLAGAINLGQHDVSGRRITMRTIMTVAACLALAGCTAVSVVPEKESNESAVKITVTAVGSALFHKPETLIDRALEVGDYACCQLMNVKVLEAKCPPEPDPAPPSETVNKRALSGIPLHTSSLTTIDQKVDEVQSIAESLKATLDVFGSHSLSMKVTCAD